MSTALSGQHMRDKVQHLRQSRIDDASLAQQSCEMMCSGEVWDDSVLGRGHHFLMPVRPQMNIRQWPRASRFEKCRPAHWQSLVNATSQKRTTATAGNPQKHHVPGFRKMPTTIF